MLSSIFNAVTQRSEKGRKDHDGSDYLECEVTPAQWVVLKSKLLKEYNSETDSLRFYQLGSKWQRKIEHHGAKKSFDMFRDPLII